MFDSTKRSAYLVAPELLPAFELIPELDMSEAGLQALRELPSPQGGVDLPEPLLEVACEEHFVPSLFGAPDVRVLVYQPPGATARKPAVLHMHGGGFVLGSPEINDIGNRSLSLASGCCVVSVDYRLAPETRYPGAVEDCYSAFAWIHRSADQLGIDAGKIAITGESAGGGHAAALALFARNRKEYPCCLLLLDSPMLDDRTGNSSAAHPYCGEYVWTPESNRFGWRCLLGVEPGSEHVPENAVPARASNFSGLPPTFIVVGALDLFMEESMEFARKLMRAGVAVELHVIPGAFHAYGAAGAGAPQVKSTLEWKNSALERAWNE